jgi:hypothetical protein
MEPDWTQPAQEPAPVQQAAEPEGEPAAEPEPAAPPKHKLKVHGQEVELSLDDIIAKAQIALASENILEDAKSKHKELDSILADARNKVARVDRPAQHQGQQTNTQSPTGEQPDPSAPEHHEDPIAKLVETLQFGDPNEARALLQKTIADSSKQVVEQTLLNQRLRDEGARAAKVLADFEGKHPEIAKDPMARAAIEAKLLDVQTQEIIALGIDPNTLRPDGLPPTPGDIAAAHRWYRSEGYKVTPVEHQLETAIESYRAWKGIKTENPADPQAGKAPPRIEVNVDREKRRAAIQQQPSQAGIQQRPAAPQPAPQPRDRSDIVAQMKERTKGYPRRGGASVPVR